MDKAEQILDKHINEDDLNFIFHEKKQLWQELLNAVNEALRQPTVSGRSEQLACIHNLERLRLIGGNITCLDCQSTWVRQANCH